MKVAALALLSLALAFAAFQSAGIDLPNWNPAVLVLAVLAFLLCRRPAAPPLPPVIAWPIALLPAWILFQLVPLPLAAVRLLSPARAALAAGLPGTSWIPLSSAPAVTLVEFQRFAGALLAFLIVRELVWRFSAHRTPWIVAAPLVLIAALEAALGLVQYFTGAAPSGAHGTYHSRDHFAGLLEMALPFAVMYGFAAWWRGRALFQTSLRPALTACASFLIAALLLLGVIHSLSRMGFLSALFALGVLAAAALPRKLCLIGLPAGALLLFIYLPPNELIARFASISTPDQVASQDRLEVWRETLPLIAEYPVTGCGLGAFESTFMRFKHQAPTIVDNYTHNDYLQALAELGLPGFALGVTLIGALLVSAARTARRHASPAGRALALASLASMAALLLHSLADFNTYIPANSFAFAWSAALAATTMHTSRPITEASGLVLDVRRRP